MSTASEPALPIQWAVVTDDLWVASRGGDFVGTIERIEERFVAVDGRGNPLGVNGSLAMAQLRLEAPAETARRMPSLVRRIRRPRFRRTAPIAA